MFFYLAFLSLLF